MTRTYELVFIVEPRQSDDGVQELIDRYTGLITDGGGEIQYIDLWGKRKLAYPIQKYNEGIYVVVYVAAEESVPPWPDVERLLMQDEKVLRHLVVRTDEDLKRALRKSKVTPKLPWEAAKERAEGGESHAS